MKPRFFFFDMGNCLLRFSHERMAEQMGKVAGVPARRAGEILFEEGLEWAFERGEFARDVFYARFCEAAGVRPADMAALDAAGNDIFELNTPIIALVGRLAGAGNRLGVFSNTTVAHWEYCTRRFGALTSVFAVHALSYRLGAMKPAVEAYTAAAKLAGVPGESIFYTDDRQENVEGARAAGWDAVVYTSVWELNEALRERGVGVNY
jgi:glucose-1-phosphatase